jgi:hypothetical protein
VTRDGPDRSRVVRDYEKWNFMTMDNLAEFKKGIVSHEGDFLSRTESFTEFYQPLKPFFIVPYNSAPIGAIVVNANPENDPKEGFQVMHERMFLS